ncbi:hypothetical protein [Nitrospira sp. Nam74]
MALTHNNKPWLIGIMAFIALWLMLSGGALAGQLWLDELRDTLAIYQAFYPEGDWSPYLEKLNVVGQGITHGDSRMIATAMEEFFTMLRSQAHGINGIAAHALYWIALGLQPHDPAFATAVPLIGGPGDSSYRPG